MSAKIVYLRHGIVVDTAKSPPPPPARANDERADQASLTRGKYREARRSIFAAYSAGWWIGSTHLC